MQVSEVYFPAAPYRGRPTRAFGYFARPAHTTEERLPQEQGLFPAMLLIHGGGGAADARWARWWARRGYAALAVDLAGQGPGRQPLPDGGPSFAPESFLLTHGLENTWIYHAIAACLAGISALSSLPGVDSARIGVTGFSWGGYFCSTVMSIDERIGLGIPVYGCGFNPRVANGADPAFTDGKVQREAFDPSNFLHRCKKPVLWVSSTNDGNAPLDELRRSVRATPGPNTLCLTANVGHTDPKSIGLGERPEIEYFADSIFREGEPLLRLSEPQAEGRMLRASIESAPSVPLSSAVVHYTADLDKPWPQRQWQSARAEHTAEMVQAELPAGVQQQQPLIAFLNAADERGAVVASDWCQVGEG